MAYTLVEPRLMKKQLEKYEGGAGCGIPNACERMVPTWLIVLDNAPTIVMFLLGSALVWNLNSLFSMAYLVYCGLSIILFWRLICPWCHHFGTTGCPCGYGRIASRLFKRKTGREFKRIFKQNICIVFPCWFIPLGTGIYLLWTGFNSALLYLFLAFCLVGFVMIPAISRLVGCRSCNIKDECPWMS